MQPRLLSCRTYCLLAVCCRRANERRRCAEWRRDKDGQSMHRSPFSLICCSLGIDMTTGAKVRVSQLRRRETSEEVGACPISLEQYVGPLRHFQQGRDRPLVLSRDQGHHSHLRQCPHTIRHSPGQSLPYSAQYPTNQLNLQNNYKYMYFPWLETFFIADLHDSCNSKTCLSL